MGTDWNTIGCFFVTATPNLILRYGSDKYYWQGFRVDELADFLRYLSAPQP